MTARLSVAGGTAEQRAAVRVAIRQHYPAHIRRAVAAAGTRIRILRPHERYTVASPLLSRFAPSVDAWPIPPAGLFVVAERTVYLRSVSVMTVCHEYAHALDAALGCDGQYLSGVHSGVRSAFAAARAFVTPYAESGIDEYFAECVRAYVGANGVESPDWPQVSRALLRSLDPTMDALLASLLTAPKKGQTHHA